MNFALANQQRVERNGYYFDKDFYTNQYQRIERVINSIDSSEYYLPDCIVFYPQEKYLSEDWAEDFDEMCGQLCLEKSTVDGKFTLTYLYR